MSDPPSYKVSGFTKEYGTDLRLCGVIVAYADGTDDFNYFYSTHESKILVISRDHWTGYYYDGTTEIVFTPGPW
jgi:hypothetical protein